MSTAAAKSTKTPVTILTGFLGSGKTTLLNHILTEMHGLRFAVIENEFGEVGVDDSLVKKRTFDSDEDVIEMNNGCICCTVRGDLIRILTDLLVTKKREFDCILIETTGLADPAPVAQTFFVDDVIRARCHLDGIITVVDAKHIFAHLDEIKPDGVENEAVEQVAFADRILLNKMDLVEASELAAVRARLHSINARAQIVECLHARVDPHQLLNINGFNLDSILEMDPEFLGDGDHKHDDRVTSVGIQTPEPVNIGQLQEWISELLKTKGTDLLRYKGIISVAGMDKKFVFQGVHMLFSGGFTEPWGDQARESRFVFIGKDLDRAMLTTGFRDCIAKPLRFGVGRRVQAHVKRGYQCGTIVKQWDEGRPYRIRLDSGVEVWGPIDEDEFVREVGSPSPSKRDRKSTISL